MPRPLVLLCIGVGAALWLVGVILSDPSGCGCAAPRVALTLFPALVLLAVAIGNPLAKTHPPRGRSVGLRAIAALFGLALAGSVALVLPPLSGAAGPVAGATLPWGVPVLPFAIIASGVIAAACGSLDRGVALAGGFAGTLAVLAGLPVTSTAGLTGSTDGLAAMALLGVTLMGALAGCVVTRCAR